MRAAAAAKWALRQRVAHKGLPPVRQLSAAAPAIAATAHLDAPGHLHRPPPSHKGKERARVAFTSGASEISLEEREFFNSDVDLEVGSSGDPDWEEHRALQPGRVAECRRSGLSTLGLILSPIIISGRPRLLILRSGGDIWPISPQDVQFLLPASLISPRLAEQCWSPRLLSAYNNNCSGDSATLETEDMLAARRKAVVTLRKVMRETEKMSGRLSMDGGSMDLVWNHFAPPNPDERGKITAREAAQYLLGLEQNRTESHVKSNTLPAFAAHMLMMKRSDLFLADQGDMWESGTFIIRSREERRRLDNVLKWLDGSTEEGQGIMESFGSKAKALISARRAGEAPPQIAWAPAELDVIHVMLLRLYETRTTQWSPSDKIFIPILKALALYPGETIDQALIARFMEDIGVLPPHDSLQLSKEQESQGRRMTTAGVKPSAGSSNGLLRGDELDTLREDFSNQRVFVIDDPGALELDDGIAIEPMPNGDTWIHVHVADPTRFLPPDHPLAIDASFRGSASYLPEGNMPLLSFSEVMGKLSLGTATSGGGQSVMTFSALLAPNAEVKESKVRLGWIKKPTVVTYGAVDKALGLPISEALKPFGTPPGQASTVASSDIEVEDIASLRTMHELAVKFRQRRLASSGLEMPLSLASTSLINSPIPSANLFDRRSLPSQPLYSPDPLINYTIPIVNTGKMSSSGMVAEFMILGGRIAAQFLSARSIPAPFRGSEAPVPLGLRGSPPASLEDVLAERDVNGYIDPFRAFAFNLQHHASTLSTTPLTHWAMGFTNDDNGYLRATSPLRRFDDLLVHWQIKTALAHARDMPLPYGRLGEKDVETLMKRSAAAQKGIKRGSKTVHRFWQARLINSRRLTPAPADWEMSDSMVDVRGPLLGRVASQTSVELGTGLTQVYVASLGLMAEMNTRGSKRYDIGEEIGVRISDVVSWPAPAVRVVPA